MDAAARHAPCGPSAAIARAAAKTACSRRAARVSYESRQRQYAGDAHGFEGPLRQSPACRHVAILRTETRTVPIVWDVVATAELKRTPNARVDCSKTHDRQALEPDKSQSQMPPSRSFGDVFNAPISTSADTHGYRDSRLAEVSSRVKFPASTAWRSRLSMDAGLL